MFKKILAIILLASATAQAASTEHSILVYNIRTGKSIVEQNQYMIRPMASITKLMTAIVSLDTYSLDDKIKTGRRSFVTVESLLKSLLIRSDNSAAEMLARNHPEGRSKFIEAMNLRAWQMGLTYTRFDDPSGISAGNVSNAAELSRLVYAAGAYPFIKQASSVVETNTNQTILAEFKDIVVSKTGFTTKAGRCLALLVDKGHVQYAIIVLGEPTKQVRDNLVRNLLLTELNTIKYQYE